MLSRSPCGALGRGPAALPLLLCAAAAVLSGCSDAAPTGTAPPAAVGASFATAPAPSAPGPLTSALAPNLCAAVKGGGRSAGTALVTAPCNGSAAQQFTLQPTGTITVYGGAMCVDAYGAQGRDGDAVILWTCNGQANQRWTASAAGPITGINGKCVDVSGASTAPGTKLVIWTCNGGANQRWSTTAAAPGAPTAPTAPGTPATPTATAGNAQATVSWQIPAGPTPTNYVVTAAPGGATQTVSAPTTTATFTGLANGTPYTFTVVAVNAAGRSVASPASAPVTPSAAGLAQDTANGGPWTLCTGAGAVCNFIGSRMVRLGPSNGPYVYKLAYAGIPCAVYGFDNQNPAPNQAEHCDYGALRTTTLINPMPGMSGLNASRLTAAIGDVGASDARVATGAGVPALGTEGGSFRTVCNMVKYAFDDPIVFPGQPGASHLHVFFGNAGVNASSTPASLVTSGNSSCLGGTLNRTAYWAPAVFDAGTSELQTPDRGVFYYKTGYNMDRSLIQPMPAGLRMITGDKTATSLQPHVYWECANRYIPGQATIPTTCGIGGAVRLTVNFPQCWDGVNLDVPDHKSHVVFPIFRNPPEYSSCPPDHPVALIAMAEHFDYPVAADSHPERWRLTSDMYSTSLPGGMSAHADWMNGWDAPTMNKFVVNCLRTGRDCQVGLLGDGTAMTY